MATAHQILSICVAGAPQSGKSALIQQFVSGRVAEEYVPTVDIAVKRTSPRSIGGTAVVLQFVDSAGLSAAPRSSLVSTLQGCGGLLLVLDLTDPRCIETAKHALSLQSQVAAGTLIAFVANKLDACSDMTLLQQVKSEAASAGVECFVTSAQTGENVYTAVQQFAEQLLARVQRGFVSQPTVDPSQPLTITVVGRVNDGRFQHARTIAENLASEYKHVTANVTALLPAEWDAWLPVRCKELRLESEHRFSPLVLLSGDAYLGGDQELAAYARKHFAYFESSQAEGLYAMVAFNTYKRWMEQPGHTFVYLEMRVGADNAGKMIFELDSKQCPKTVANFVALATGAQSDKHYKGTPIHRVVPGAFVQGGDLTGKGDQSVSSDGGLLPDETFAIKHTRAGIIGMVNTGAQHTNGSQFYITLAKANYLDERCVAFGRLIEGTRTLNLIAKARTKNQRPDPEIVITDCGLYVPSKS